MATIENPPRVPAPRYTPRQILAWMSLFCLLFVIAFAAVLRPNLGGELLPLVIPLMIGVVVLTFAVFMICLWAAAWLDTASFSEAAWQRSGHVRWVWTGVTLFLWPIGSLLWYAAIRPQLARAEQAG